VARRAGGDGERESPLPGEGERPLGAVAHRRDVEATVLHQAVRGHLSSFLAEAAERGGLPRFVERDFTRYLECGVLAHGFARLACAGCRAEVLVPFSCKSRGVCPSCNARRAHDTAIHLTERVLLRAPYRQWTLSFPMPVRFSLARDARLLSAVLGLFVRALFAFQRRTARRLGVARPLTGAVAFVQRFGSALQLTTPASNARSLVHHRFGSANQKARTSSLDGSAGVIGVRGARARRPPDAGSSRRRDR
jgi:Transposase zinc-binding domain